MRYVLWKTLRGRAAEFRRDTFAALVRLYINPHAWDKLATKKIQEF